MIGLGEAWEEPIRTLTLLARSVLNEWCYGWGLNEGR